MRSAHSSAVTSRPSFLWLISAFWQKSQPRLQEATKIAAVGVAQARAQVAPLQVDLCPRHAFFELSARGQIEMGWPHRLAV